MLNRDYNYDLPLALSKGKANMFGWLKKNSIRKLEQDYAQKLKQAMELQRKGDIVGFAAMSAEAEAILQQLQAAEAAGDAEKS